jgi:H/ACA ribonucleoprotein complex subunit 3
MDLISFYKKYFIIMLLRYYTGKDGSRVYTLSEKASDNTCTLSAHPAKFSPDDQFSEERMICKKRFNLLLTQRPELKL